MKCYSQQLPPPPAVYAKQESLKVWKEALGCRLAR